MQQAKCILIVLSAHYQKSSYCLCELGAAWMKNENWFLLKLPDIAKEEFPSIVCSLTYSELDSSGLDQLRDELSEILELKQMRKATASWNINKNACVKRIETVFCSAQESIVENTTPAKVETTEMQKTTGKDSDDLSARLIPMWKSMVDEGRKKIKIKRYTNQHSEEGKLSDMAYFRHSFLYRVEQYASYRADLLESIYSFNSIVSNIIKNYAELMCEGNESAPAFVAMAAAPLGFLDHEEYLGMILYAFCARCISLDQAAHAIHLLEYGNIQLREHRHFQISEGEIRKKLEKLNMALGEFNAYKPRFWMTTRLSQSTYFSIMTHAFNVMPV